MGLFLYIGGSWLPCFLNNVTNLPSRFPRVSPRVSCALLKSACSGSVEQATRGIRPDFRPVPHWRSLSNPFEAEALEATQASEHSLIGTVRGVLTEATASAHWLLKKAPFALPVWDLQVVLAVINPRLALFCLLP